MNRVRTCWFMVCGAMLLALAAAAQAHAGGLPIGATTQTLAVAPVATFLAPTAVVSPFVVAQPQVALQPVYAQQLFVSQAVVPQVAVTQHVVQQRIVRQRVAAFGVRRVVVQGLHCR